jgi:hypothetical protein
MKKSDWVTMKRPGWFGEVKDEMLRGYDEEYGAGNWRIRHQLGPRLLGLEEALRIYELCYELHFLNPHTRYLWTNLFQIARDVWTEEESDIESGVDYAIQKAKAPHYEDVSIRIIMQKYQQQFKGDKMIRIRADSKEVVGVALSSIHIPFIFPKFMQPTFSFPETLWWNRHEGSLEYFWHSNKILQVRNR